MKTAQEVGAPAKIIETVVAVNDARKHAMAEKIVAACGGSAAGKTVAVLGLAFKPNTDDLREAASLVIVPTLQAAGATVRAHDPQAMHEAEKLMPGAVMCKSPYEAAEGADVLVILTEWDAYRALDLGRLKRSLREPVVVDLRNIYRPDEMAAQGFQYSSIGRPANEPAREVLSPPIKIVRS